MENTIVARKAWNISMARHLRECSPEARRFIVATIDANKAIISEFEQKNARND